MENTLNLFLVISISLKTRCTHLGFKGYVCMFEIPMLLPGVCVCVSEIPRMLPGLALTLSVFQQQQQKENQLRQILLGRKPSVRLRTASDSEEALICIGGITISQLCLCSSGLVFLLLVIVLLVNEDPCYLRNTLPAQCAVVYGK